MSARIIDGKAIAKEIRAEIKAEVEVLKKQGVAPCLAAVLVGEDPASRAYVANKRKACEEVGIKSVLHTPHAQIPQHGLMELVQELNEDTNVHGILVQLPLPGHIDELKIIESMSPHKDVDGFHPINLGKLVIGLETFISCTPAGIIELIIRSGHLTEGKHVVIIGRSNIVGKPMMNILVQKAKHANATVTDMSQPNTESAFTDEAGRYLDCSDGKPLIRDSRYGQARCGSD